MPSVISARGVSKQYVLGGTTRLSNSLRDVIADAARAALRREARIRQSRQFWALDDVSFDVEMGEVVGVIGHNGAGKSTLFKVLSRITEPTKGRVEIRGRAASLLEVGTGFHPELTGRENIYLNGTILGMRKKEIDRKLDEIVSFAEVEKFVDTPVKRYSSGMYVRLAFGVAAHLDPEILIIDEVLAVGDISFQKKCLGKMSDVAHQGRTVLFVSHNMAAVRAICSTGLLLKGGRMVERGPVDSVIEAYSRGLSELTGASHTFDLVGDGRPQFTSLSLADAQVDYGERLTLNAEVYAEHDARVAIEMEIHDHRGSPIIYTSTAPMGQTMFTIPGGQRAQVALQLGPLPLAAGEYTLHLWLIRPGAATYHKPSLPLAFEVVHSDPYGSGFEFRQAAGRGAVAVAMSPLTISPSIA